MNVQVVITSVELPMFFETLGDSDCRLEGRNIMFDEYEVASLRFDESNFAHIEISEPFGPGEHIMTLINDFIGRCAGGM